eukprot:Pgem_evm1s5533
MFKNVQKCSKMFDVSDFRKSIRQESSIIRRGTNTDSATCQVAEGVKLVPGILFSEDFKGYSNIEEFKEGSNEPQLKMAFVVIRVRDTNYIYH